MDELERAYEDALALEKAGRTAEAAAAWRRVLALDPADHGGAAVRLAGLGAAEAPERMPEAYLRTLFDQQAERFDETLVERLGYGVPGLMADLLARQGAGRFARLLDLGCGTGLTGTSLADLADEITGVDLSEEMLGETDERDCYDHLYVGEAVAFLAEGPGGPWDLITATDVLPYLGALEAFFGHAAGALTPGGVLIVSTETLAERDLGGRAYLVGARHRFAHDQGYVAALIAGAGLEILEQRPITVRYDEGQPVPGFLIAARKSSAR